MQIYGNFSKYGIKRLCFFVKNIIIPAFNKLYADFSMKFARYFVISRCLINM